MFRTIVQNIRVYVVANWVQTFMGALGMLLVWSLTTLYQGTNAQMNERIADIAKSSESTAQSMHELVVFVKEDRVKITQLEERMKTLEEWRALREQQTVEFYQTYDLHKRK